MSKEKPAGQGGHAKERHASKVRRFPRKAQVDAAILAFSPHPYARIRVAREALAAAIEAGDGVEIRRRQDELNHLLNGRPA